MMNARAGAYGVGEMLKVSMALAGIVRVVSEIIPIVKSGGLWAKIKAASKLLDLAQEAIVLASVKLVDFVAELRELDPADQDELITAFVAALDIEDNDVERVIEAIYKSLVKGSDFVASVLAAIDSVKP